MKRRLFCKILLVVVAVFSLLALSGVLFAQGRSEDAFEHVKEVQERHADRLMAIDGVEGTAIGFDLNDRPTIKVFTSAPEVRGIPQELEGVRVQPVVTGKFYALTTARFDRPVPTGVSTGHPAITAGTIGCRVTDGSDVYALSNNHVYANSNNAVTGDAVIQPGTFDGGSSPADDIGTLFAFEPIDFSGGANTIDAAIALSSTSLLRNSTPSDGYGIPSSITADAVPRMRVQKYGRTTGLTNGRISEINVITNVNYGDVDGDGVEDVARFVGQIAISPGSFSAGGDSGSLIVTREGNKPVGLLFAGSFFRTIANPIDLVLDHFGVTVDDQEGPPPPPPATGSIGGTVTSASDDTPIAGATVSVDTGQSTTTISNGTYTINDVPIGNHIVTASASGFVSQDETVEVAEGETTTVNFSLNPAMTGDTVSVVSIDYATSGGRYGTKHLLITVALVDDIASPVAGASVSIDLYLDGLLHASGSGTTGTDGTVTFTLNNAPSGIYATEVTDVTAAGLTWDGITPDNGSTK